MPSYLTTLSWGWGKSIIFGDRGQVSVNNTINRVCFSSVFVVSLLWMCRRSIWHHVDQAELHFSVFRMQNE